MDEPIEPIYSIFRGPQDKNAVWIDWVAGLTQARARMEAIAAATPGQYFVFDPSSRCVLARIDTSRRWPLLREARRIA
jgi:hypothetical protein